MTLNKIKYWNENMKYKPKQIKAPWKDKKRPQRLQFSYILSIPTVLPLKTPCMIHSKTVRDGDSYFKARTGTCVLLKHEAT